MCLRKGVAQWVGFSTPGQWLAWPTRFTQLFGKYARCARHLCNRFELCQY